MVKNVQAAAYNGVRTVHKKCVGWKIFLNLIGEYTLEVGTSSHGHLHTGQLSCHFFPDKQPAWGLILGT